MYIYSGPTEHDRMSNVALRLLVPRRCDRVRPAVKTTIASPPRLPFKVPSNRLAESQTYPPPFLVRLLLLNAQLCILGSLPLLGWTPWGFLAFVRYTIRLAVLPCNFSWTGFDSLFRFLVLFSSGLILRHVGDAEQEKKGRHTSQVRGEFSHCSRLLQRVPTRLACVLS